MKKLALRGVLWSACESSGVALLSFAAFAVLARILDPEDFGVVALAGVFVQLCNLAVVGSFSDALVQRSELEPEHPHVAFWSTFVLALGLGGLLAGGSGIVAQQLKEPQVADVLPWLAIVLPVSSISAVQTALYRRQLEFRTVAISVASGRMVGAVSAIAIALSGGGLWSLVVQQVAGAAVTAVAIAAASSWRPALVFSRRGMWDLWRFGASVSVSNIVNGGAEQAVNLLVGTMFGSVVLGYFNVAWRTIQLLRSVAGSAVYHVGFSAFSRLHHSRPEAMRAFIKATRLSCLFGLPLGVGIALLSEPIVALLYGEAWARSGPVLAILGFELVPSFYAIFFAAYFRAFGRPGWVVGLSILYAATGIGAIFLLAPFGIEAVAAAWLVRSFVLLPLPVLLMRRLTGLSLSDLLAPAAVPVAATLPMVLGVEAVAWIAGESFDAAGLIGASVPVGAAVYIATTVLLSPDLARFATGTVRDMFGQARPPAA